MAVQISSLKIAEMAELSDGEERLKINSNNNEENEDDENDLEEAIITCNGDLHDPDFNDRLQSFLADLESRLWQKSPSENASFTDAANASGPSASGTAKQRIAVRKVEPWNSVRVTIVIPNRAAERLKQMAAEKSEFLVRSGILAVEVEGHESITISVQGQKDQKTKKIQLKITDKMTNAMEKKSETTSGISAILEKIKKETKTNRKLAQNQNCSSGKNKMKKAAKERKNVLPVTTATVTRATVATKTVVSKLPGSVAAVRGSATPRPQSKPTATITSSSAAKTAIMSHLIKEPTLLPSSSSLPFVFPTAPVPSTTTTGGLILPSMKSSPSVVTTVSPKLRQQQQSTLVSPSVSEFRSPNVVCPNLPKTTKSTTSVSTAAAAAAAAASALTSNSTRPHSSASSSLLSPIDHQQNQHHQQQQQEQHLHLHQQQQSQPQHSHPHQLQQGTGMITQRQFKAPYPFLSMAQAAQTSRSIQQKIKPPPPYPGHLIGRTLDPQKIMSTQQPQTSPISPNTTTVPLLSTVGSASDSSPLVSFAGRAVTSPSMTSVAVAAATATTTSATTTSNLPVQQQPPPPNLSMSSPLLIKLLQNDNSSSSMQPPPPPPPLHSSSKPSISTTINSVLLSPAHQNLNASLTSSPLSNQGKMLPPPSNVTLLLDQKRKMSRKASSGGTVRQKSATNRSTGAAIGSATASSNAAVSTIMHITSASGAARVPMTTVAQQQQQQAAAQAAAAAVQSLLQQKQQQQQQQQRDSMLPSMAQTNLMQTSVRFDQQQQQQQQQQQMSAAIRAPFLNQKQQNLPPPPPYTANQPSSAAATMTTTATATHLVHHQASNLLMQHQLGQQQMLSFSSLSPSTSPTYNQSYLPNPHQQQQHQHQQQQQQLEQFHQNFFDIPQQIGEDDCWNLESITPSLTSSDLDSLMPSFDLLPEVDDSVVEELIKDSGPLLNDIDDIVISDLISQTEQPQIRSQSELCAATLSPSSSSQALSLSPSIGLTHLKSPLPGVQHHMQLVTTHSPLPSPTLTPPPTHSPSPRSMTPTTAPSASSPPTLPSSITPTETMPVLRQQNDCKSAVTESPSSLIESKCNITTLSSQEASQSQSPQCQSQNLHQTSRKNVPETSSSSSLSSSSSSSSSSSTFSKTAETTNIIIDSTLSSSSNHPSETLDIRTSKSFSPLSAATVDESNISTSCSSQGGHQKYLINPLTGILEAIPSSPEVSPPFSQTKNVSRASSTARSNRSSSSGRSSKSASSSASSSRSTSSESSTSSSSSSTSSSSSSSATSTSSSSASGSSSSSSSSSSIPSSPSPNSTPNNSSNESDDDLLQSQLQAKQSKSSSSSASRSTIKSSRALKSAALTATKSSSIQVTKRKRLQQQQQQQQQQSNCSSSAVTTAVTTVSATLADESAQKVKIVETNPLKLKLKVDPKECAVSTPTGIAGASSTASETLQHLLPVSQTQSILAQHLTGVLSTLPSSSPSSSSMIVATNTNNDDHQRVPPLHISLRGKNSIIVNKQKSNLVSHTTTTTQSATGGSSTSSNSSSSMTSNTLSNKRDDDSLSTASASADLSNNFKNSILFKELTNAYHWTQSKDKTELMTTEGNHREQNLLSGGHLINENGPVRSIRKSLNESITQAAAKSVMAGGSGTKSQQKTGASATSLTTKATVAVTSAATKKSAAFTKSKSSSSSSVSNITSAVTTSKVDTTTSSVSSNVKTSSSSESASESASASSSASSIQLSCESGSSSEKRDSDRDWELSSAIKSNALDKRKNDVGKSAKNDDAKSKSLTSQSGAPKTPSKSPSPSTQTQTKQFESLTALLVTSTKTSRNVECGGSSGAVTVTLASFTPGTTNTTAVSIAKRKRSDIDDEYSDHAVKMVTKMDQVLVDSEQPSSESVHSSENSSDANSRMATTSLSSFSETTVSGAASAAAAVEVAVTEEMETKTETKTITALSSNNHQKDQVQSIVDSKESTATSHDKKCSVASIASSDSKSMITVLTGAELKLCSKQDGRSPNSVGHSEDSGVESMDALSEKSPNQSSQSPHSSGGSSVPIETAPATSTDVSAAVPTVTVLATVTKTTSTASSLTTTITPPSSLASSSSSGGGAKKTTVTLSSLPKPLTKLKYLDLIEDKTKAMWLMMQQEKADDYVIATGETKTVREFVEASFRHIGKTIVWQGSGLDEVGIESETGTVRVKVNAKYFRPTEVSLLKGDASKAQRILKWKPQITFDQLVANMMESDIELMKKDPTA